MRNADLSNGRTHVTRLKIKDHTPVKLLKLQLGNPLQHTARFDPHSASIVDWSSEILAILVKNHSPSAI